MLHPALEQQTATEPAVKDSDSFLGVDQRRGLEFGLRTP